MSNKIGVYVCHCGGNISDYVDVEKVRQAVEKESGVFLAKTTMFACADSNQNQMVDDIKENGLDSVIVASCSPKLHLTTFRAVTERAGLNKYNYVHANIREQVSWAHSDKKVEATEKAIQIVKAAIAKVRFSKALDPIKIKSEKVVAIIGAGVAGMRSAIEISNMGAKVYLIEKNHFIGGRVAQWDKLSVSGEKGYELTTRLYKEVKANPNITLFTGAELVGVKGSIGNFNLEVKITPRYIKNKSLSNDFNEAIKICPVEVDDEFNFGLTKRKAIYNNKLGQFPELAVIDNESCTHCGECEKISDKIDFSQKAEILHIKAGSILTATGFDPYTPSEGEFGYQEIANVVTLQQFVRMIAMNTDNLMFNGKLVKNIAYIYCVGSRQPEGENKYCSRYCCTSTIYNAGLARDKFKDIHNFHFTRGIRTYGKQELLYNQSSKAGDIYLQSFEDDLPTVEVQGGKTIVKINDVLTKGEELEVEADLVVLVTGMVPRANDTVGSMLKIPKGRDKFFNEIHMKLRPVEIVIDGITIAGTCQGPKNITESINSALAASIKSFTLVNKGELELEPIIATVDNATCSWCEKCSTACPYDAISQVEENGKQLAFINHSVCKGCGMCLPVCPSDSIELTAYSNKEVESMIDALITQ
jgi:heterodisulfide reductase subunit A2